MGMRKQKPPCTYGTLSHRDVTSISIKGGAFHYHKSHNGPRGFRRNTRNVGSLLLARLVHRVLPYVIHFSILSPIVAQEEEGRKNQPV